MPPRTRCCGRRVPQESASAEHMPGRSAWAVARPGRPRSEPLQTTANCCRCLQRLLHACRHTSGAFRRRLHQAGL
eukprot:3591608-Alexandrium_andersonii.AAC.1